jgi:hypothetical protein
MRGEGIELFKTLVLNEPENQGFSGLAEYTCSAR